ncbi:MAG: 4-(cytidine 5'-diphospho)-2-C-methyl-D-erythritol kinase [Waddliaceae bacterium]
MQSIRVPSYAKINLGLLIHGRRRDGFHEIETILQQIDLRDEIEVSSDKSPEIRFSCNNPNLPADASNLCVRAAVLLKQKTGVTSGVTIRLNKTIPVGAGLGGGSSNAAATLLALNQLWGLNLEAGVLQKWSAELGSDVPFFIRGGAAIATGKGEILQPRKELAHLPILVVFPKLAISTQWAYGQLNLSLTKKKKNANLASFNDINFNMVDFTKTLRNEFEEIIFAEFPVLRQIKKQMEESKALFSSLSGSGSALFAIFRHETEARMASTKFRNAYPTFVTHPIKWGFGEVNKAFYSI